MNRDEVDRLIRYHEVDRRFIDFIPVCKSWLTLEQRNRELEEALTAILGWRERDRNNMKDVMNYIEGIANKALNEAPDADR